jgi:hypothetical protein
MASSGRSGGGKSGGAPAAKAATAGTPAVAGHWTKPANMEPGITQQWAAPVAAVPGTPAVPAADPVLDRRARLAMLMRGKGIVPDSHSGGGSRQRSGDAGYSTSGRSNWGGSSGGRGWW